MRASRHIAAKAAARRLGASPSPAGPDAIARRRLAIPARPSRSREATRPVRSRAGRRILPAAPRLTEHRRQARRHAVARPRPRGRSEPARNRQASASSRSVRRASACKNRLTRAAGAANGVRSRCGEWNKTPDWISRDRAPRCATRRRTRRQRATRPEFLPARIWPIGGDLSAALERIAIAKPSQPAARL